MGPEVTIDWQHELSALKAEIDKLIKSSGSDGNFAHTIQIVTMASAKYRDPMSRTWSCKPEIFQMVVEDFTGFSGSGAPSFTQSLVGEDYKKAPYWYTPLGGGDSPIFASEDDLDFQLRRAGPWSYNATTAVDQVKKLEQWRKCLANGFASRGATIWVSQSHFRPGNLSELPTSSAFVLFNNTLSHEKEYPVAKLLRDFLVRILITQYYEETESPPVDIAYLQEVLNDPGSIQALGRSIIDQLKPLEKAIVSPFSMLVTGESGTGKMGVAQRIHAIREYYFSRNGMGEAITPLRPCVINVGELEGKKSEIRVAIAEQMKMAVNWTADRKLLERGRGIVVFDDIHLAPPPVQDVIRDLLDKSFTIPTLPLDDWLPLRKPIFISLPGLSVAASSGRFNPSLFAQISAFEVICPPLHKRLDDLKTLLPGMLKTLGSALKLDKDFVLSSADQEYIFSQTWPGNFRELQGCLTRMMLDPKR